MIFKSNNHRKWLSLVYIIIFFLLEIMIVSNNSFILEFDHSIQNILGSMVSPINTKVFSTITFLGSPMMDIIYLLLIMFILFKRGKKDSSLWIGFVLISGNIIAFLVKMTVRRQRPLGKIIPASGYSFPSGHVFGTTLVILTLIFLILPTIKNIATRKTITVLLITWLIIVAISRVYLRGHFPSDAIGSALLAGTWWECCELLYLRYYDSITHLFDHRN
ncbi:phosphatase PAP2 family protein [Companilactobacillus paralimentarius]|uniref:phosphatase PAP2 family protein n=1 Tax=Companilactobacillus paralimentarius TaxID=83526 RepID=UPI00046A769C|nr:phosphatase PAP2 family protein [Companilactobacillus paralimentarius]KAE9565642.1 hypothetical protein ATN96_02415 [Companilactobacillus paralimentarius]MDR4933310.1 phosphatase PAP2 family protein [Companilactobacillus paralimentarius]QFR69806.1 phosphatase PAP2 family protein [Companilactobacillus paralimentarius]